MAQVMASFQASNVPTGWLTLDASDNDASRLLTALKAASAEIAPGSADSAVPLGVLDDLSQQRKPFALFLDDFEVIHASSALSLVRTLLESLPPCATLVVGTRSLPEIPVSRMRAKGQVLEIEADVLRFNEHEAGELFGLHPGTTVPPRIVRNLTDRTEGWIAALSLASRWLQDSGESPERMVERFSGTSREIAEFLTDDVFSRQPENVRDFLLRTSILRHLEAPLCQALLPTGDAAAMLEVLEKQNLFVVALPGRTPSWRYQRVFADYLRARLSRERPGLGERLHLLAAEWYESQGRPVPAIDHAVDAGDHPLALTMLAPVAQQLLEQGRMRLLSRWVESMPATAMDRHSVLQAVAVWATLFTRGPRQATTRLENSGCLSSTNPQVVAHVTALRPLLLSMQDRYDEAMVVGSRSLEQLPTSNPFADGVLRNAMAHVLSVLGQSLQAQKLIDGARRITGPSAFSRMYAESVEGMVDLQAGRLRMASSRFRDAVGATRESSHNYASGNAWAGLLYASTLYEEQELEAAERLLDVYLPMACDVGLPGHMNVGHMIRCRIAFSRGEVDRSFEALTELEYLGHHRQLPRIVANAKIERARLLIMLGNAQAAQEELDRAEDPGLAERLERQRLPANEIDYPALARVRWSVHFGDARDATQWLRQELLRAVEQGRHRRALRLRVLLSLALQRGGDPATAAKELATTLRQAAEEGFVRIIADEGREVGQMVQRHQDLLQQMPAKHSDPAQMRYLTRLLSGFGAKVAESDVFAPAPLLIEPLTRKEIQVLQLVADGCSNALLVEKLGASDSTVRTHLRSINSKLSVHSRNEAVIIGRRLGMVR
jgi:LuxR family maltose regulon positive regulatory protein